MGPIKEWLMISNYYAEILKKFQHASRNCGVRLRDKNESVEHIIERINQLELQHDTECSEYRLLVLLLRRSKELAS
jgi:hypothetical protein